MIVNDLYKDNLIKFEHSEVNNSIAEALNAIGATESETLRTLTITPSDDDCIFVSKEGTDLRNDTVSHIATMTEADPNLTSSGGEATGYEPWRAFDGLNSTYWEGTGLDGYSYKAMLQYEFTEKKVLEYFTIQMPNISLPYSPISQVWIYGSNDGTNWNAITMNAPYYGLTWTQNELKTFTIKERVRYKYYKLTFVSGYISQKIWAGEIKLYGEEGVRGTQADPVFTIEEAIYRCNWHQKTYIIIDDSGTYDIQPITIESTDSCKGIIANIGLTPTLQFPDVLDNFKFCRDILTGIKYPSDAPGENQRYFSFGTYDGSHYVFAQRPQLLNDGTIGVVYSKYTTSETQLWYRIYDETFTTILLDVNFYTIAISGTTYQLGDTTYETVGVTDNYLICCGRNGISSTSYFYHIINNKTGVLLTSWTGSSYQGYLMPKGVKGDMFTMIGYNASSGNWSFVLYEIVSGSVVTRGTWANPSSPTTYLNAVYQDGTSYLYIWSGGTAKYFVKINLSSYVGTVITVPSPFSSTTGHIFGVKYGSNYYIIRTENAYVYKVDSFDTMNVITSWNGATYGIAEFRSTGSSFLGMCQKLSDSKYFLIGITVGVYDYVAVVLDFANYGIPSLFLHDILNIKSMSYPQYFQYMTLLKDFKFTNRYTNGYYSYAYNYPTCVNQLFESSIIKTDKEFIFDGIIFDGQENPAMKDLIRTTEAVTLRFCTIQNIYNESVIMNFKSYIIQGTVAKEMIIENNAVLDVDYGLKTLSNSLSFKNNLFLRCVTGTVLENSGGSENIICDHNTFFNNYAGIELISNAGTEIIKNSIFYTNNAFGVKTGVLLQIKNSICTDTLIISTLHSSSKNQNPLFVNEGIENPEQVDCHLQTQVGGFQLNSPAMNLGDDTYDAGCYRLEYTLAPSTYTSFVMIKPKKITFNYSPVNFSEVTMQDGTYDSSFDAIQQEINLEFDTLPSRYTKDLLTMYMKGGEVRLYLNPISDPFLFETVKMSYKDLPFESDFFKLNDHGTKGFKFTFIRKFSIEELE